MYTKEKKNLREIIQISYLDGTQLHCSHHVHSSFPSTIHSANLETTVVAGRCCGRLNGRRKLFGRSPRAVATNALPPNRPANSFHSRRSVRSSTTTTQSLASRPPSATDTSPHAAPSPPHSSQLYYINYNLYCYVVSKVRDHLIHAIIIYNTY